MSALVWGPDLWDLQSDCWVWNRTRNKDGYGIFRRHGRRAHRVAWEMANGRELLPTEVVRHTCDNPPCVRPDHLVVGTQFDNMKDMRDRNRSRAQKKTHCEQGHEFNEANTYITPGSGWRKCRACKATQERRYRERKKIS